MSSGGCNLHPPELAPCKATCRRSLLRIEAMLQEVQALREALLVGTTARTTCYTCSELLRQAQVERQDSLSV